MDIISRLARFKDSREVLDWTRSLGRNRILSRESKKFPLFKMFKQEKKRESSYKPKKESIRSCTKVSRDCFARILKQSHPYRTQSRACDLRSWEKFQDSEVLITTFRPNLGHVPWDEDSPLGLWRLI